MYKTHVIQLRNLSNSQFDLLKKYCWHSARLYNSALFLVRKHYKLTSKYLSYYDVQRLLKTNIHFQYLTTAIAQQILIKLDENYKTFFALINKYKGTTTKVRSPKYLDKKDMFSLFILMVFNLKTTN